MGFRASTSPLKLDVDMTVSTFIWGEGHEMIWSAPTVTTEDPTVRRSVYKHSRYRNSQMLGRAPHILDPDPASLYCLKILES